MKKFVSHVHASHVVFGRGALAHWSARSTNSAHAAGVFARAVMHVPLDIVRQARAGTRRLGADCAVAIGGGSTTGLGKAIALDSGLPILAIPTTYAGSEMTPIYGITDAGLKRIGTNPRVLPRTVIYDPELTLGLPVVLSVSSGMNAIAHAAEGLYARDGNPLMALVAEEGIRALAAAPPAIRRASDDLEARSEALYGAWLCGTVPGNVGMALHHNLCHTLGAGFNLPHAGVHMVVLPHAIACNAAVAPEAMLRIRRALGAGGSRSAAAALFDLARDNGAPVALRDLGMRAADLGYAATIAVQNAYWNSRQIGSDSRAAILALLRDAFAGQRPV